MKTRATVPWMFMLPGLVFLAIFVYYPIVKNFQFSLLRMNSYTAERVFVGLQNYRGIFQDDVFYTAIMNNVWYAVISVAVQVGFGMILAIVLEGRAVTQRASRFFRNVFFLPSVISITAVGLTFYFIYNPTVGFLNAVIELFTQEEFNFPWLANPNTAIFSVIAMSQWQWTGYITLLLIVAIQKIPAEYYEVADMDGATAFQRTVYIIIPQIRDMIVVTSIITVIGAFVLFTEIFVTTRGGPYGTTHVLGTYMYETAFFHDKMGYAAAIAAVIFVITFTLSFAQLEIGGSKE